MGNGADNDPRRFGHLIPKPDGTVDILVHSKAASLDVLAELAKITEVIFHLQPVVLSFHAVAMNHEELLSSSETFRARLSAFRGDNMVPMVVLLGGFALLSQKIANFLSSASAFLSQTQTNLSNTYGSTSAEAKAWNAERHRLHEARFSYRFLYELRNYSQHWGLPLSSLNVSGERTTADSSMLFQAKALILRDGLLSVGYKWGKLQMDLLKQPSEFDLLPLCGEYFATLRSLCLSALRLQDLRLAECARYFDTVKRILQIPVGALPIVVLGDPKPGIPPSRFSVIPMDQFEWLLRHYESMLEQNPPQTG